MCAAQGIAMFDETWVYNNNNNNNNNNMTTYLLPTHGESRVGSGAGRQSTIGSIHETTAAASPLVGPEKWAESGRAEEKAGRAGGRA